MKIWFDISNSPHINIFNNLIRDLQEDHDVIITARPLANTVDLLKIHNFEFTVVGQHYGANFLMKIFGYPIRVAQLYLFLRKQRPDVAISHSSFHSPLVARLLGIPSIYMNDNEHALGNIMAFICAGVILIPEFLDRDKVRKQWANVHKIVQYPGVKEGFYLWPLIQLLKERASIVIKNKKPAIFIRPEPRTAQYYKGQQGFMDSLLIGLRDRADITIFPRDLHQQNYYLAGRFLGINVSVQPLKIEEIVKNCDFFIGAGGTMTREMAVLGIPTISVYQSELLDVDKYLIKRGFLVHKPDLTAEFAMNYWQEIKDREVNFELLDKGKQAYNLIRLKLLQQEEKL